MIDTTMLAPLAELRFYLTAAFGVVLGMAMVGMMRLGARRNHRPRLSWKAERGSDRPAGNC